MDSYIVRIYRRTDQPPELAGQVEKAGTEVKVNFHSSGELVKILMGECGLHGGDGEGVCLRIGSGNRAASVPTAEPPER